MRIALSEKQRVYRQNQGTFVAFHLDGLLLIGILMLIGVSSLLVFSASGGNWDVLIPHLVRVGFAFSLMLAFAQIPPHIMRLYTPWLFTMGLLMLIAVPFVGEMGKGAQRWLDFGFVRFQPSELMKLSLPLMIAWLYAKDYLPPPIHKLFAGVILVMITAGLIVIQPDLGTSILIALSGLFVIFFAGLSWWWILSAILLVAASVPIIWEFYMYDYQKQRVLTFLNPESDPLGAGYHIIQSKIAIGSGGIDGKGFLAGTQTNLEFLPESTTDFIFSVLSEEFGLIGVIGLLSLYLFVIARGLYIATQAQDNFGRLVVASLTMTFFVYVFVNIGMVSGLLPVVGLPLPLISYGGSSLVTLMISFGIIMSIHTHKKLLTNNLG